MCLCNTAPATICPTKNLVLNLKVITIKYDPRITPIQAIQAKDWRAMVAQDKYLEEVFEQPPLTAYSGRIIKRYAY